MLLAIFLCLLKIICYCSATSFSSPFPKYTKRD
nr:MAG TPA: hypothetical protein [Caudoviricetes sp.]